MATFVTINGNRFKILENTLQYCDRILSHTFKLGGEYEDCINISLTYENGKPKYGKIGHIEYDPMCVMNGQLNKGKGTILMVKTLLQYIHNKFPNVIHFKFDDMSHIECGTKEEEKQQKGFRKKGSLIKPMSLYYLSIIYNNETWYEKYFNAEQENKEKHLLYRNKLSFLVNDNDKPDFIRFLEISQPPQEQILYLENKYTTSKTYSDFFKKIPKEERCKILAPWLDNFIKYYLKDVFNNIGWIIDITKMKGGRNNTRKRKYYLPNNKIINYNKYQNIGDINNI
jgi:hypothetical protein